MAFNGLQSLAIDDPSTFLTLVKLECVGLVTAPVFWLRLMMAFAEPKLILNQRQAALLLVVPGLTLLMVFTNEQHGLIWQQATLIVRNDVTVFAPQYGAGFVLFVAYACALMIAGGIYVLRNKRMQWRLYRLHAALLIFGAFLLWVRNLLLIFDDVNPFAGFAFDALLVSGGIAATALALLRVGALGFMPAAYRTIFNLLPLGAILLDRDNYIAAANREVALFLNKDISDIEGHHASEIFPEQADWVRQLPSADSITEKLHVGERTVEVNTVPILNRSGQLIGTLLQARDITGEVNQEIERQRAEQTARVIHEINRALGSTLNTEEVMRRLLVSVRQLVDHDASNVMLYDAAARTVRIHYTNGYTPSDDAWLRSLTFSLDDYAPLTHVEATRKPLIVPNVNEFEGWVTHKKIRPIRGFACAPIFDDQSIIGFLNLDVFREGALSPEISHRLELIAQQAGTALRNAQRYEQAQKQADELQRRIDSLLILQKMVRDISATVTQARLTSIGLEAMLRMAQTRGGYIATAQDSYLQLSAHYGSFDLTALNAYLCDPQGLAAKAQSVPQIAVLQQELLPCAMQGAQVQIVLPLRQTDDVQAAQLLGVVVLEDDSCSIPPADRLEMLTLLADRLSVALQNAALITQANQRAAELEQLNAQLHELEDLKSEMLRVAAHDLKTPLQTILNYTVLLPDLVRQGQNIDPICRDVRKAAERMNHIIHDLLSLERISRLATQQTPQIFAVHTLFDKLQVEFFMAAHRHNLTLETAIESPPLHGVGDPILVYEALSNLVSNAFKYTPAGGRVRVEAQINDSWLRIAVTDTGLGIPLEEQDGLFTAFYRTRAARESNIEGTGLGLHLTKKIIERQRGRVFFSSVVGQGSTFGFELPLPPASA
jgi:signal transduction histidine kinase/PAS domain-containing protein